MKLPRQLSTCLGLLLLAALLGAPDAAQAAKIGDLTETNLWEQARRFFLLQDPAVRYGLLGSILLGVSCGLLGSFIVVRKLALMGDTLSHAVLPGVALGFLWTMTKNPLAILIGATVAGLLGAIMVNLITQTTRLKEDAALGMVLAGFFALGICLVNMIQRLPNGHQSGLDSFLFGQAASIGRDDLVLMGAVTALSLTIIGLFYKEFLVTSFDPAFARVTGLPVKVFHHGLMLLLAFSVVIALQAVGVVLVSAMLITPAAAAYLLTDRMHRMVGLAALFGLAAGVLGAFLSFLGNHLPTGPFMVLSASLFFGLAFLLAPRHGVITRWWRHWSRTHRIQRENTLKAIYHVLERDRFAHDEVSVRDVAERQRTDLACAAQQIHRLRRHGLATWSARRDALLLTPDGFKQAATIVRNHRLWELYLTNAASIAADHVHDDAEKIEHILGEDVVRQLERRLDYATQDPHGRPIPSTVDIHQPGGPEPGGPASPPVGYGRQP
jgi:manganese/zinc/iron transport system permease protein